MSEKSEMTAEEKERLLRGLWRRRQLNSVVLLILLICLYLAASSKGHDGVAQISFYLIVALPVFAALIAWWDRHWLWKNQERMLKILARTKRS
jgi:hypothetical protein